MAGKMADRRRKRRLAKREFNSLSRGTVSSMPKRRSGDTLANRTGSGFHSSKGGKKGYTRRPKHKDVNNDQ
ncbi:MAG: hypothetical protein ABIA47_04725 [bacterium]